MHINLRGIPVTVDHHEEFLVLHVLSTNNSYGIVMRKQDVWVELQKEKARKIPPFSNVRGEYSRYVL